jgi:hypothetical protein
VLTEEDKKHLIINMSGHLKDAQEFLQKRAVAMFSKCDPDYGNRLQEALNQHKKKAQVCASSLCSTGFGLYRCTSYFTYLPYLKVPSP